MKTSARHRLRRRDLLRYMGASALALPFLELFDHEVRAAEGKSKFAVFIYTPDGVNQRAFWPTGTVSDFQLSPILAPFEPFKDKLLVMGPQFDGDRVEENTGLRYGKRPPQHQAPICLAANPGSLPYEDQRTAVNRIDSPSIDQVIAEAVKADLPFSSLNFGLHPIGGDTPSDINYTMDGTPLRRMESPDEAWNRVFGGMTQDGSEDAAARAARELRKHSAVSDFLYARFGTLAKEISAHDRQVLDRHLASLRTVEERKRRLLSSQVDQGEECSQPTRRDVPTDEDSIRTGADSEHLSPFFMDMISTAFTCNLTKVASVTFGYPGGGGAGGLRMPWLGFTDSLHYVSHHGNSAGKLDRYARMHTWIASQVAYLMQRLADTPMGDGTLLDHTTIYWFNRHGDGESHTNYALPNVLLGGTGGYFKMGRFLNLPGTNVTRVLLSIAHAMGVEIDRFGKDEFEATEPLAELASTGG